MKRIIPFFCAFVILVGICLVERWTAQAETVLLSGSSISLEIIDSTKADAISDSLTDVRGKLETKAKALTDSVKNTHTNVLAKTLAATDSIKNTHTNVLAKVLAATDSTKNTHTNVLARVVAAIDSISDAHSNLVGRVDGMYTLMATVAVNVSVTNASPTTIFDLSTADTRYVVNNLRLKAEDPGANTITVTLYELINDVQTAVDTFAITTANYTTYFCLPDLFTVQQLSGDNLKVVVQTDAGTYTVTGQYNYGKTGN